MFCLLIFLTAVPAWNVLLGCPPKSHLVSPPLSKLPWVRGGGPNPIFPNLYLPPGLAPSILVSLHGAVLCPVPSLFTICTLVFVKWSSVAQVSRLSRACSKFSDFPLSLSTISSFNHCGQDLSQISFLSSVTPVLPLCFCLLFSQFLFFLCLPFKIHFLCLFY